MVNERCNESQHVSKVIDVTLVSLFVSKRLVALKLKACHAIVNNTTCRVGL
jgi:hypothetical protein